MLITQLFLSLHRALRIEDYCDIGQSLIFLSASMHPLVTDLLPNKPLLWCWIWQLLFVWCDPRKQRHSASMCRFTSYHILRHKYPSKTQRIDAVWDNYQAENNLKSLTQWGWQKDGSSTWQPLWSTLSDASMACSILLHCGCLKAYTGRCKCNRAGVRCTALCKCEGGCVNSVGDNR